jgi:hypothetical protein
MTKPLPPSSDHLLPVLMLSAALLVIVAGCSRGSESSPAENFREQDSRRIVASRDGRREIPQPPPAEEKSLPDATAPVAGQADSPAGPQAPRAEPGEVKAGPQPSDGKADIQKMAAQAARLVDAGLKLWDDAKDALDKDEQGVSDGLLLQAYRKLEEAHRLYEELCASEPGAQHEKELQSLERNMYEIQKAMGSGD